MQINNIFDTEMIRAGLNEVAAEYISRPDFGIVDYQEMIVAYLLNAFVPDRRVELRFLTTTTGELIIDNETISFGIPAAQ